MSNKPFRFTIEPWTIVRENNEYETSIFNLLKRHMELDLEGEAMKGEFYALQANDWVTVIPVTREGRVILVEQFRFGIDRPTLEIPGGIIDPGEEPLETAERELLEETGYRAEEWSSLGKVSTNPAILTNFSHLFLARGCHRAGSVNPDPHERIRVHEMEREEFLEMASGGTIHHSIVLAAVGRWLLADRNSGGGDPAGK